MNVTLRTPLMTQEQFLDWVERQESPFEFDGFEPVPMTGGTLRHALLCSNIVFSLRKRLDGSDFQTLSEAGVGTIGETVRYPDVMILPVGSDMSVRIMPNPVVVFEVVSPSSGRIDRHSKLIEYRAVPSIRRYVIVDGTDLMIYARADAGQNWIADALTSSGVLAIPEVGIQIPVAELFVGVAADSN